MIIFNLWGHDSHMSIVVQGGKYLLLFYDVNSTILLIIILKVELPKSSRYLGKWQFALSQKISIHLFDVHFVFESYDSQPK